MSTLLSVTLIIVSLVALRSWLLHHTQTRCISKTFVSPLREALRRLNFLINGRNIISKKYSQTQGHPFLVKTPSNHLVIVSSERHLQEVSSAAHSKLSLHAVAKELLQPKYTMQGFQWHDERGVEGTGFVRALRSLLTAQLPVLQPALASTIIEGLNSYMSSHKSDKDETCVSAFDMIKTVVSKANCLMFFGQSFADNPKFVLAALNYAEEVVITAEVLRTVPWGFRSLLATLMSWRQRSSKLLFDSLLPEVSRRIEFRQTSHGTPLYSKTVPADCMQWLIDTSPLKEPWTAQRMVHEIMAIWFSSIHQLAMVLTFTLEDLCLHQEYAELLRNEIQCCMQQQQDQGTDIKNLDLSKLELLESFITESSRKSPLDAVSVRRKALEEFHFSDSTLVAKDDWVCCALDGMMTDARYWPSPDTFDGFRFARPELVEETIKRITTSTASIHDQSSSSSKIKFTDVAHPWVMWGTGDKACPGRFYSSMILKLVMTHVLQNYDCRLKDEDGVRSFQWRTSIVPRGDTAVILKKR